LESRGRTRGGSGGSSCFPTGRPVRLVERSGGRLTDLGAKISGCEGRGGVGVGDEILMRAMDSPFGFRFRGRQWKDGEGFLLPGAALCSLLCAGVGHTPNSEGSSSSHSSILTSTPRSRPTPKGPRYHYQIANFQVSKSK
jgi:hypothetical protein